VRQSTRRRATRHSILAGTAATIIAATAAINPSLASAAEGDDVTAPVVALTYPQVPTSGWFQEPVTIQVSGADDTGITRYVAQVGDTQTEHVDDFEIPLGAGVHEVTVTAYDAAGNQSSKQATIKVDDELPRIDGQGQRLYILGQPGARFDFYCGDAYSGVQSCTASNNGDVDTSAVGNFAMTVTAVDRAGNIRSEEYYYAVVEDTQAPIINVSAREPLPSGWYNQPVSVSLRGTDNYDVREVRFELSGAHNDSKTIAAPLTDVTVENDGVTHVRATAVDLAGNESEPQTITISLDATAPTVAVDPLTPNGSTAEIPQGKDVALRYTCADATSGVNTCTVNGTKSIEGEVTLPTDELGDQQITIEATDMAGNSHEEVVEYRVVAVDPDRPVVEYDVEAPSPSGWYRGDVSVTITATDNESVDHIDWATYGAQEGEGVFGPSGGDVVVDTDGETEVWMYATDEQENYSAIEKVFVKRDATAPTILANGEEDATLTFVQGVTGTISIECEDATSGVADCGAPEQELLETGSILIDTTTLGEGTVTVVATDVAGNEVTREVAYAVVSQAPASPVTVPAAPARALAATGVTVHPALPLTAAALFVAAGVLSLLARKRRS
jgi:hypothetical protein